jgi:Histidine kinase
MYPFIFSRNIWPKLARHLAFWGLYGICSVPLHLEKPSFSALADRSMYEVALADMLGLLPVYLFSVYFSIYYILPRYLATRNRSSLIWCILFLFTVSMTAGYFVSYALIERGGLKPNFVHALGYAMHRCQANLVTITAGAVLIKIMKDDYFRQRENEMLVVEHLSNRLRLLKMQLHPRVLFSSLESIYAEMENETPRAPRMILKLSDLLSYLLYESDTERIALSKEVGMMENYVQLKMLEYPDNLEIHLDTSELKIDHLVPPGLFLPILEIGIEPTCNLVKPVLVDIELRTSASKLYFSVINNCHGIGTLKADTARFAFEQVKTNLQSLLTEKFKLDMQGGPDDFSISMEMGIDKPVKPR